MKKAVVVSSIIVMSSLVLISCSSNIPTSPTTNSATYVSQESGKDVDIVVGGQVATQSISDTEQVGTGTLQVQDKTGHITTLYLQLHGTIVSQEPTMLNHVITVFKDAEYKKSLGTIYSQGDVAITTGYEYPVVSVYETVNIANGTDTYKKISPDSTIAVAGTLNLENGQNQFEVVSGTLIY